jgi:putative ATP-binding cassette transporter
VALTRPFFQSELRWQAFGLLGLLVGLAGFMICLQVINSDVNCHFMTAVSRCQPGRFATLALVFAGVFAASTVIAVFQRFTEERLGLKWRDWLTRHLVGKYLARHAYYHLNARDDIDNPDQRIAEDVKTFTVTSLSFFLIGLNSVITLCSFSYVLWSITPWLFLAAVIYAAFGSLTTILLGRKLIGLNVLQLKKEADLRCQLIQVRTQAEPIALQGGEEREKKRIGHRLAAVVENMRRMIALNRNVGFFTNGYNYFIQLIPVLIVAPLYMRGEVEFGKVTQAAMVFATVMNAFSLIVEEFQRISSFGAVIERVGAAWEAIEEVAPALPKSALEVVEDGSRVSFERLTLVTPREGRLLVEDLTVQVPRGQRLLIMGPPGSGRSALIRAAAGLWTAGQGRICRPPLDEVMFLPQRPYLSPGSLRDQFPGGHTDERLLAVLRKLRFEPVLKRVGGLDVERDWSNTLSVGEQQLLGFARLLLANPRFAFLEEPTSALDPAQGQALYEMLFRTPITYVSVGKDAGLMRHHDLLLKLGANGGWALSSQELALSA